LTLYILWTHHLTFFFVFFSILVFRDIESHRGLCHGGAYTSLFDDFCGHISFISGNSPW
jgi:hypothetical protein